MPLFGKPAPKKESKTGEGNMAMMMTELEKICENDRESYEALINVMFLDPRKIEISIKDAADNAKRFEKEKNLNRARIWYEIAGGLAIYEGNPKKVVEFFGSSEKISGTSYPILKKPEKAVAKAQEYYKKYLKTD